MLRSESSIQDQAVLSEWSLDRIYKKTAWRLLPFLLLAYGIAYIDRINISFAQVELSRDLGFTNTIYGFGAGIFFIGYMVFEIPCNYLLTKVGERRFLGSIMIAWGLICCALAAMQGPTSFYTLRFLLGVAEAGFTPAFILYLSRWYPQRYQGRIMGLLLSGPYMAAIIGGPASGAIMEWMDGVGALKGWQWLFLIEGMAPVLLGFAAFRVLVDNPAKAKWLTAPEKAAVIADLAAAPGASHETRFVEAFRNPTVYLLALSYFCLAFAGYALIFWLPTLIKDAGVTNIATIGYLSALPPMLSVVCMIACGVASDRTGHRIRYIVVAALLATAGLVLIPFSSGNIWLAMTVLCVGNAAMNSANAMFWALPSTYLRGPEAAGGIAVVVTVGVLGGFISPIMIGRIRDLTGSFDAAFFVTAGVLLLSCVLVPLAARAAARRTAAR